MIAIVILDAFTLLCLVVFVLIAIRSKDISRVVVARFVFIYIANVACQYEVVRRGQSTYVYLSLLLSVLAFSAVGRLFQDRAQRYGLPALERLNATRKLRSR